LRHIEQFNGERFILKVRLRKKFAVCGDYKNWYGDFHRILHRIIYAHRGGKEMTLEFFHLVAEAVGDSEIICILNE
jgi:hypothetical protein